MVKSFKTNILTWLKTKTYIKTEIDNFLNGKSDTNHTHTNASTTTPGFLSAEDKTKLNNLEQITVDSTINATSTNPVQNKVINTALTGKANTNHTHSITNITNLQSQLAGKANSVHTHDDRYYTETEMNTKLNGKANSSHTHDDRYYTESEMNTKLNNKANNDNLIIQKDGEIKIVSRAGIVITSWWTQHITCNKDTWVNFIDSNYTNTSGAIIYGDVPIVGGGNAKLRIKNNSEIIEINTPIANPTLQAGQLVYLHY